MKPIHRRSLGVAAAVALLLVLAVPKLLQLRQGPAAATASTSQAPLPVKVHRVQPGRLSERLATTGTVRANEEVEIVESYKKTYDMILDAFAELNVTKVETVGTEFDYECHQAMMQMPSDEYEEGIVCQEFAMGWRCGETLIRPAMVVVAA